MPEPTSGGLDGAQRAAVLLLSLGEENAAQILKHMAPKEVQLVGSTMATLKSVSRDEVGSVLEEFFDAVGRHTALGIDSASYLRKALEQALGAEKAGSVIDRILLGDSAQGLESLKWMEGRAVAEMIRFEHPQIIAIILSYLDSDHAADILGRLDDKVQADVLVRVATLDAVQPAALAELNEVLERQVAGAANAQTASVDGARTAADILNYLDTTIEAEIMEQVRDLDADLGQRIQDLMFVFDNLADMDDTAVQTLLREVSSDSLLLALKGADDAVKEKFFKNMSKRAAEMLRDDLEAKGPVRVSEVEVAQKEIVGVARRLAEEGQIAIGGKGGEDFV